MTARFSMNLDNHVERGHGSQLASWKVWLSSTRWQEGQLQEEGHSRRRQQQNSSHCVFCVIGSFGDLKWRSADLVISLVVAIRNSVRSCCGISAYNNIIACRGVPIVSLGVNDLIGNRIVATCRNNTIGKTQYARLCHFGAYCVISHFPYIAVPLAFESIFLI